MPQGILLPILQTRPRAQGAPAFRPVSRRNGTAAAFRVFAAQASQFAAGYAVLSLSASSRLPVLFAA